MYFTGLLKQTLNSFLSCLRSEARGQLLFHRDFKVEIFTLEIYNTIPDFGFLGKNKVFKFQENKEIR